MSNTIIFCACGGKECNLQMSVDWSVYQPGSIIVVIFTGYGDACHEEFTYAEFLAKLETQPVDLGNHVYPLPTIVGNVQTFLIDKLNFNRLIDITKEQAVIHGIALPSEGKQ